MKVEINMVNVERAGKAVLTHLKNKKRKVTKCNIKSLMPAMIEHENYDQLIACAMMLNALKAKEMQNKA